MIDDSRNPDLRISPSLFKFVRQHFKLSRPRTARLLRIDGGLEISAHCIRVYEDGGAGAPLDQLVLDTLFKHMWIRLDKLKELV